MIHKFSVGLSVVSFVLIACGTQNEPLVKRESNDAGAVVVEDEQLLSANSKRKKPTPTPTASTSPTPAPTASPTPIPIATPAYHGFLPYNTFNNGVENLPAYTNGRVAFYSWTNPSLVDAARWSGWYGECMQHYEKLMNRTMPLYFDPNFGLKKTIAVVGSDPMMCGTTVSAGCGDGQRLQLYRYYGSSMAANPTEKGLQAHWTAFYELGRGTASLAPFFTRGFWPTTAWHSGFPHYVAAICMQQVGGIDRAMTVGLNSRNIMDHLARWELDTRPYASVFVDANFTDSGGFRANDILGAMLYTVHQQVGADVMARAFSTLSAMPYPATSTEGLCNLQNAIAHAAGRRFDDLFVTRWRLPQCL